MGKMIYQGKRKYEFKDENGNFFSGYTVCVLEEQEEQKEGYMPVMVYDNFNKVSKLPKVKMDRAKISGILDLKPGDEIEVLYDQYRKPVAFQKVVR